jgi:hypothetical protein
MKTAGWLLTSAMLGFAIPATWASSTVDATVLKVAVVKTYGEIAFIKLDKLKDGAPSCHTNPYWDYVMTLTSEQDKKMYALLLTARTTQLPVSIDGAGNCQPFNGIETVEGIHM